MPFTRLTLKKEEARLGFDCGMHNCALRFARSAACADSGPIACLL
jgi:hypothetical protein